MSSSEIRASHDKKHEHDVKIMQKQWKGVTLGCDVSGGGVAWWPGQGCSKAGVERMKQQLAQPARPYTRTAPVISNPLTLSSFSAKIPSFK